MNDEDKTREQLIRELVEARQQVAELEVAQAERKQVDDALQESERRFRWLAEHSADLIFCYRFTSPRGFEYVSPAATEITGYTPEEYYADPQLGLKIVHPDDRPKLEQWFQGDGVSKTPAPLRWVHRNGTLVWIEQRVMPVYDEAGNLLAVYGMVRDVTDREQSKDGIRRETARLRELARIGARLNAQLNLNTLLHTVCEEAARTLDVPVVLVLPNEPAPRASEAGRVGVGLDDAGSKRFGDCAAGPAAFT